MRTRGTTEHTSKRGDGFAVRVLKSGRRIYRLRYRIKGVEKYYTIGDASDWTRPAARTEARRLRQLIDQGRDPLAERQAERTAETVRDLVALWREADTPHLRPRTVRETESLIRQHIDPEFGRSKVADVTPAGVARWHHKIGATGRKVRANRALAVLSRLFSLAVDHGLRADNPCARGARGAHTTQGGRLVRKYPEAKRRRYLTKAELNRLLAVLATDRDRQSARILLLLLATGARFTEMASAKWEQFDAELTVWTKPAEVTKQKREHAVPLNQVATGILREIQAERSNKVVPLTRATYVFPASRRAMTGHVCNVDYAWSRIRKAAELGDFRIHDLRHSFASFGVSAGLSLPEIGELLGHTNPVTTARYAHLFDEAKRAATEKIATQIGGNVLLRSRGRDTSARGSDGS